MAGSKVHAYHRVMWEVGDRYIRIGLCICTVYIYTVSVNTGLYICPVYVNTGLYIYTVYAYPGLYIYTVYVRTGLYICPVDA